MVDHHMHSYYSHDSNQEPREVIEEAIKKGIKYISFTDHYDRDYIYGRPEYMLKQLDLEKCISHIFDLQKEYEKDIYVGVGIETGYCKQSQYDYKKLDIDSRIDVVINSIHTIYGYDCYFQSYFDTTNKKTAYNDYLDCVIDSVDANYDYQIIGHIGYITRKAPYEDKTMTITDYREKLEKVFKRIIEKEKTIEINTNIVGEQKYLPTFDMLKLYKDLGGEYITFSSDAHNVSRLHDKFDLAMDVLKKIGFTHLDYFIKRERHRIKIK